MQYKTISINQSYDFAWEKFKEKALFFIGLGLLNAIKSSWNVTKGHTLKLFLWIILSKFIFIL